MYTVSNEKLAEMIKTLEQKMYIHIEEMNNFRLFIQSQNINVTPKLDSHEKEVTEAKAELVEAMVENESFNTFKSSTHIFPSTPYNTMNDNIAYPTAKPVYEDRMFDASNVFFSKIEHVSFLNDSNHYGRVEVVVFSVPSVISRILKRRWQQGGYYFNYVHDHRHFFTFKVFSKPIAEDGGLLIAKEFPYFDFRRTSAFDDGYYKYSYLFEKLKAMRSRYPNLRNILLINEDDYISIDYEKLRTYLKEVLNNRQIYRNKYQPLLINHYQ